MDYEKLHKDTIAKLQEMVNSGKITVETACGICADFIPESKDEKIMKAIIKCLKWLQDEARWINVYGSSFDSIFAWVEKQRNLMKALQISNARIGELIEENYYLKEQFEKQGKNNMGISEATKKKLENSLNEALEKETPESWNKFLDEQGERKPKFRIGDTIKEKSTKDIVIISEIDLKNREYRLSNTGFIPFKYEHLWELVEQNPANKVEPKFEIGDLITNGVLVGKIDEIHELGYHAYFGDHYADVPDAENWHKWTIQDAKDGDVLACPNDAGDRDVVFIFKNINSDDGWVFCFCASDANGCFCTNNDYVGNSNSTNISPATKEQRDLLFQKMKEAGYEWDAEKKELKKIELQLSQWNISDFRTWQYIVSDVLTKHDGIGQYLDDGFCKKIAKYMQEEWSKKLSLGKNTTEWSEEDEKMRAAVLQLITDSEKENCWNCVYCNDKEIYFSDIISWLKSIRPQSQWKPSDKLIRVIEAIINNRLFQRRHLDSLYQDLLKLKGLKK